jgi:hypothetical protein
MMRMNKSRRRRTKRGDGSIGEGGKKKEKGIDKEE